jgi:hypothetical protein
MVRFVHEDPVRTADVSTHLLQTGEQRVENLRPVFEL